MAGGSRISCGHDVLWGEKIKACVGLKSLCWPELINTRASAMVFGAERKLCVNLCICGPEDKSLWAWRVIVS